MSPLPLTRDDLCAACARGFEPDYLFFWSHKARPGQATGPWVFSQWFPTPFEVEGDHYPTAEHFMMAEKARLFGDRAIREQILLAPSPAQAKALGRQASGFDQKTWTDQRFDIVTRGSIAKFSSSPALRDYLLSTENRVLVEASPRDLIWGIGLGAQNPKALNPGLWRGLNLLGFALMNARLELQSR